VDFETLLGAREWGERIRVRTLESGDMPPAGGPLADERDLLQAWLDCDMPGDENPLPSATASAELITGYLVHIETDEVDGLTSVDRIVELPNPEYREGLLRRDWYRVNETVAQFAGWEAWDADGELIRAVTWDPPLQLLENDEQQTVATWMTADDSGTEDQVWTRAEDLAPDTDGHALDPEAWQLTLTEEDGEQHGWLLSDEEGFVAQWALSGSELLEFQQLSTGGLGTTQSDFPLQKDRMWVETVLVIEVTP